MGFCGINKTEPVSALFQSLILRSDAPDMVIMDSDDVTMPQID